ncbi:MAG: DUF4435 domain-containing protein [Alphaproteobacteria bacterium]|nr:DUF4435 domain-containing protein [Alphaproteobacteria bacterium]
MSFPAPSPGGVAGWMKMMRAAGYGGAFLLVEGPDDRRFWTRHVPDGGCRLHPCGGRQALVDAMARGVPGAAGVMDADFDHAEGRPCPHPGIARTDTHDLETLLIRSPALLGVLAELGQPERIARFEAAQGPVRGALLARGLPLGALRWLSVREGLGLDLDRLSVRRFVDARTWDLDVHGLYAEAARLLGWPAARLLGALDALPPADPWQVVQGHDLVRLLAVGLRRTLGDNKPSVAGEERVAALLRTALDRTDLLETDMARALRRWQGANPPYQVLAA